MMLAGANDQQQGSSCTCPDLSKQIEAQVAKQVEKRQVLWTETFVGQVVVACAISLATAIVTQKFLGRSR